MAAPVRTKSFSEKRLELLRYCFFGVYALFLILSVILAKSYRTFQQQEKNRPVKMQKKTGLKLKQASEPAPAESADLIPDYFRPDPRTFFEPAAPAAYPQEKNETDEPDSF